MPTALCSGSHLFRQVIDVNLFLGCCESTRFARIETDRDHVKLVTDLKRQHAKRSDHAVEHLRAEHRTVVVDEREHDRFATEEFGELYLLTRFIAKDEIEWQLLIEFLFDPNFLQSRGQTCGRISVLRPRAIKRRAWPRRCLGKRTRSQKKNHPQITQKELHCRLFSVSLPELAAVGMLIA